MKKLLNTLITSIILSSGPFNLVSCSNYDKNSSMKYIGYDNNISDLKNYILTNNNANQKEMLVTYIGMVYDLDTNKLLWNVNGCIPTLGDEPHSRNYYYYYNNHMFYSYIDNISTHTFSTPNYLSNIKYDQNATHCLDAFNKKYQVSESIIWYDLKNEMIIYSYWEKEEYYKVLGDNNFQKVEENSW